MPQFESISKTLQEWAWQNTVLSQNQIGIVFENNAFKIGNGKDPWNALPYATMGDAMGLMGIWDALYKRELRENKVQDLSRPNHSTYPTTQAVIDAIGSGGGGSWGNITGNLADQSDLVAALDGKQNLIPNSDAITQGFTNLFLSPSERSLLDDTSGINTGDQTNIPGNAATATSLQNARTINGVSFNGTGNITIEDPTKAAKSGDTFTGPISGYAGVTNAQTGTTYTLQASDRGCVLTFNNASPITVTIPSGLGVGFNCTLMQIGAGQVTLIGSGATISNYYGHNKLIGLYATATLYSYSANAFLLGGQTA